VGLVGGWRFDMGMFLVGFVWDRRRLGGLFCVVNWWMVYVVWVWGGMWDGGMGECGWPGLRLS